MEQQALVFALIGILGIGAQWIAWRTGWPAIALMLAAGVLAGPVTGLIVPERTFGELLEPMVSVAVALILFEGGLSLNFRELRKTEGAVTRLMVIGIPLGWVLGTLACYYVAGLVWPVAILFAGILVVTGPTVVIPLLRQSNVAPRPRAILKWEAIVNDPFGALCAVITYEYLRRVDEGGTLLSVVAALLGAAVVAGLIGYATARAIAWAFPRGHVPEYLKAPVLLVAVIGTFVLSNLIQQETGLLAVTVMGVAVANMRLDSLRDIHPFKENVTVLLISGVFVLLSASLNFEVLRLFEWRFIAFLLALLFLVRPATVLVALAFSKIPWNERLLVAWIAPRGVVAVAVSGLFALRLDQLGYGDGSILVTLSFSVVVATIVAHGFSIRFVARWLGVMGAPQKGLLIVGSTPWSLSLARQLKSLDLPVMISDASWQRLAAPRQAGIATYHGEILAETTEERLDLTQFQVLVATTENEAYNALVCNEFAPEIGRDAVYQLGGSGDDEDHRSLPEALRGRAMFAAGHGVEEIMERETAGWTFRKTRISEQFDFTDARSSLPDEADMLFVLRKDGRIRFFTHASRPTPQAGDIVVSYGPSRHSDPENPAQPHKKEATA
ncbi:sodium:proton antiporter [Novosphingobium resinovorum]|uniref:Na(+):H(+) antiporter n=1 Tax=Novosphingobium resinovorum TaxID=158500 RepID=A0A031K0L4_9SPHN|nr:MULTISPECIES: sodium:proton antiporter [Sphingomonadaceae]AOR79072.1 sodium:proton antiporter [Novosphingobium resinovorum]EJU10215.1 Na(+):H(+) antiporter [Sphingomonas sp. LH128]EZP82729.1 Na(+):H(+) antiporter [Novosphingobium resinovorum]MBF7014626.1 sodium:proton antiporter [Novosphingobium sp. HR1a]WJM24893.1 sodium:proton antiporter [Novosphingobium resinovorum]